MRNPLRAGLVAMVNYIESGTLDPKSIMVDQHTEPTPEDSSTLQPSSSHLRLLSSTAISSSSPLMQSARRCCGVGANAVLVGYAMVVYLEAVFAGGSEGWRQGVRLGELVIVGGVAASHYKTNGSASIRWLEWALIAVAVFAICAGLAGFSFLETLKIVLICKLCTSEEKGEDGSRASISEKELLRIVEQLQELMNVPEVVGLGKIKERISVCIATVLHIIRAPVPLQKESEAPSKPEPESEDSPPIPSIPTLPSSFPSPLVPLFADVSSFSYNIFMLRDATQNHALHAIGSHLLIQSSLCSDLQISVSQMSSLLTHLESLYNPLSYHNRTHAADVTQCVHCFITLSDDYPLTTLEKLTLYIAAAAHDVGHPGLNNLFLVATRSPLAVLYNDKSVLENHHVATLFSLTEKPDSAIFAGLSETEYRKVRAALIDMILFTDMKEHGLLMSAVKKETGETGRTVRLAFYLHCADISNPARPWSLAYNWCNLLLEEFFAQGDQETHLGIPLGPLNDRKTLHIPKCQIGFIEGFVLPTFSQLLILLPKAQPLTENLRKNCEKWGEEATSHQLESV